MQAAHNARPRLSPRQRITNVTKQSVLNLGLRRLHRRLVLNCNADITEMPMRANGTCRLQAAAFFRRLLCGELELKNCMHTDVSAAQPDIRNLTVEQLITIYVSALDFTTESEHHHAHMNFLGMVKKHLFEKLARQSVQAEDSSLQVWLAKMPAQLLQRLGVQLTLLLGAGELLAGTEEGADLPCPVAHWILQLEEPEWANCSALLFKANELQAQLLEGERPDLSRFVDFGLMSMALDRSAGRNHLMLDWDITTVDPEDAASVCWQSVAAPSFQQQQQHATELMDAIARRRATATEEVRQSLTEARLELEEDVKQAHDNSESDIEKASLELEEDVKQTHDNSESNIETNVTYQLDPQQLTRCLQHLGYPDRDDVAWQKGLLPEVCLRVTGHKKVNGHRWYMLECQLVPCNGGQPTLEWSVRKRMIQMTELHNMVKQELGDDYKNQFVATPFAHRLRPPGTTGRLSSWCLTLGGCISTGLLRPEAIGKILHRLEAPVMSCSLPQVL